MKIYPLYSLVNKIFLKCLGFPRENYLNKDKDSF